MTRSLLRHVEDLKARGYAVVEDALDPQAAGRLCGIVDSRFDRHREQQPGARYLHEFGCVALDKRFAEPLHSEEILAIACAMLGWNIWVYHSHLDVNCPIPAGEFTYSWHRDGGRMNPDLKPEIPLLSVKAGFFLTDLTVQDSGQMWVVPGSHLQPMSPIEPDKPPPGAEPIMATAGSAVIFDRRIWHSRGPISSGSTRRALFYAFAPRWVKSRDDAAVGDDHIHKLDPVRRQLVGWGSTNRGAYVTPDDEIPLRDWWLARRG